MDSLCLDTNDLDQTTDKNSTELVQLCRALGLYILIGRIRGDSLTRFMCYPGLGASVVDYNIITNMDPSFFSAFTVIQQPALPDNNQIIFFLNISRTNTKHTQNLYNVSNPAKIQMGFRQHRQIYSIPQFWRTEKSNK